jgi:hypothetical protein
VGKEVPISVLERKAIPPSQRSGEEVGIQGSWYKVLVDGLFLKLPMDKLPLFRAVILRSK